MLSRALLALMAAALATSAYIDIGDPEQFVRQSGSESSTFLCSGWMPTRFQTMGCFWYCLIVVRDPAPSSPNIPCVDGNCDCSYGTNQGQSQPQSQPPQNL